MMQEALKDRYTVYTYSNIYTPTPAFYDSWITVEHYQSYMYASPTKKVKYMTPSIYEKYFSHTYL